MRVLLVAVGTRGDVQPVLALAREVSVLGHDVRLCISPNFVEQATSLGFDAVAMGVAMRAPAGKAATLSKLTPDELRRLRDSLPDLVTNQFDTIEAAAEGCDLIVGGNAHQYAGPSVAQHRGIPFVTAVYAPVALPTLHLPPAPVPGERWRAATPAEIGERWAATRQAWNDRARERINANRARLGMGPIDDVLDYVLTERPWLAADPILAPAPATDGVAVRQTGAWLLTDDTPLDPDLQGFLDAGEPPVLVGFGSMPAPAELGRVVIDAVRATGRRIVVSRGWGELDIVDRTPHCHPIGDANFDALFPRLAAVVHHGGAGTTTAAARAGVPQVITPMFSDQFYWGSRVEALRVGATAPDEAMTAASVAALLERALDPTTMTQARALSPKIVTNGAQVAARELIAEHG